MIPKPGLVSSLRQRIEDLEEENSELRKAKAYLEMENAIARREAMDWMQRTAQRNGEIR